MLTLKDIALRLISIMITVISEKRISGLRDYVETTLFANIVINSDIISAMIIEVDRDVAKSLSCQLISVAERELTSGSNCSGKQRHGLLILKVQLSKKASLFNKKACLVFP